MPLTGIFSLSSAHELREKLRHDFTALQANPIDPYLGFNFFVTAEHLLDWQYPGDDNKDARRSARQSELLLQIASHVANGAKHFVVEAKHHVVVKATRNQPGWFGNWFGTHTGNYIGSYFGYTGLLLELDGDAAREFGKTIRAVDIAEKLLSYWDAQPL